MPVLRIRPEGGGPERTIHRNNVRPCPYAVPHLPLETDSSELSWPDDPQVPQLPNADWRNYTWYPVYAPVAPLAHRESATSPKVQPNKVEGGDGSVRRSQRENRRPPSRHQSSWSYVVGTTIEKGGGRDTGWIGSELGPAVAHASDWHWQWVGPSCCPFQWLVEHDGDRLNPLLKGPAFGVREVGGIRYRLVSVSRWWLGRSRSRPEPPTGESLTGVEFDILCCGEAGGAGKHFLNWRQYTAQLWHGVLYKHTQ